MTLPNVRYEEATGDAVAPNPGIQRTIAVIGCSELGTDLSVKSYGNAQRLVSGRGAGPGPRVLGHVLRHPLNAGKIGGVFCKAATSTPGSFGTVNVDNMDGTATPVMSGTPLDYYEFQVTVETGGTIGASGITYYRSKDSDRHRSGLLSLGTSASVAFTGTGATMIFNPPLAGLIALIADVLDHLPAHFADTSSHGAADTGPYTLGGDPTTYEECITRVGQILTASIAHVSKTAGTVHGAADTVAAAALAAITVPTTAPELPAAINAIVDAYEAHRVLTTGTVHSVADTTNDVTAADASTGTLVAGDIITCRSVAPMPSTAAVTAAFAALKTAGEQFAVVACAFPCTAAYAAVVAAGMTTLLEAGKATGTLIHTRMPNAGESDDTWMAAIAADYASFTDDRMSVCDVPARCTIDDGAEVLTLDTPAIAAIAARAMSVPDPSTALHAVALGALDGVTLVDGDNELIHHDEFDNPGLDAIGHITLRRYPDPSIATGTYLTNSHLAYPPNSRIYVWPDRRVANILRTSLVSTSLQGIGAKLVYVPGDVAGTGVLSEAAAEAIRITLAARAKAAVGRNITNYDSPTLIVVDRNVTVSGASLSIPVTCKPIFYQYAGEYVITLAVVR